MRHNISKTVETAHCSGSCSKVYSSGASSFFTILLHYNIAHSNKILQDGFPQLKVSGRTTTIKHIIKRVNSMSNTTKKGAFVFAALSLAVSTAVQAHGPDHANNEKERVIVEFVPGSQHLIEASLHLDDDGHLDDKDKGKKDDTEVQQRFKRFNAMAIEVPHAALHGLMNNPNVISVTPDEK